MQRFTISPKLLACHLLILLVAGPWNTLFGQTTKPNNKQAEHLLLLKTGRIVRGIISESSGGYVVDKLNGSMLVPFEHVQFEAYNLKDAYLKQRKVMTKPTASKHIRLAQWCLSYQMADYAIQELKEALQLEPNRSEARQMLKKLVDDKLAQDTNTQPTATFKIESDTRPKADAESLSGLSRQLAIQYVRRIQPMLMNKCSNANCHGSAAKNNFQLTRVHVGRPAHRIYSERNLATVLKFIDLKSPERSPLVTKPSSNHGRNGRALFYGPSANRQLSTLRNWVVSVANDKLTKQQRAQLISQRKKKKGGSLLNAVAGLKTENQSGKKPESAEETESEPNQKSSLAKLSESLREKSSDVFDPELFNRGSAE